MKKWIVGIAVMLGLVALGVAVQGKVVHRLDELSRQKEEGKAKQAEQDKPPPLTLARPIVGPRSETLRLTGTLRPEAEVALAFKVPGRVVEVAVKRGDVVAVDQLLARIDGRDLDAQLAQADAGKRAAEAQRGIANDALRRARALAEAGAASEQQVVSAAGQTDALAATIAQAGAAKRYLELIAGETRLTSPIAGVVTQAPTAPGFVVQVMSPASFVIQKLDRLKFVGHLDDADAARVRIGQAFELVSAAGVRAVGTIDLLIPTVDAMTRRVPIEGTVANDDGRLFAGAMVEAAIEVPAAATVVIPLACLLTGSTPAVLVVGAGRKLERRDIAVARAEGDRLLVRAGLSRDDLVVVAPGVDWRAGDVAKAADHTVTAAPAAATATAAP